MSLNLANSMKIFRENLIGLLFVYLLGKKTFTEIQTHMNQ